MRFETRTSGSANRIAKHYIENFLKIISEIFKSHKLRVLESQIFEVTLKRQGYHRKRRVQAV
jgi:hypothetical protein